MYANQLSQRCFRMFLFLMFFCGSMFALNQASASKASSAKSSKHELFELKKGKKSFTFGLNYSLSLTGGSFSDSNSQEALEQAKELNPQFDSLEQTAMAHNFGIAGSFSYFVSDNLAVFASVSFSLENFGGSGGLSPEKQQLPNGGSLQPSYQGNIELGLKYFFSVSRHFLPYIGGGVYYSFAKRTQGKLSVNGTDKQGNPKQVDLMYDAFSHKFSVGLQVGALIPVTKNVALDIGGRATLEKVWAQAGVSYFF